MQKDANLVELEKCCQTHIFLQNFVLIQPRTSPPKICKIFEKCIFEKCLFEKCIFRGCGAIVGLACGVTGDLVEADLGAPGRAVTVAVKAPPGGRDPNCYQSAETSESVGWQNFGKMLLVFGCIGSDFCKKICVLQHFSSSTIDRETERDRKKERQEERERGE